MHAGVLCECFNGTGVTGSGCHIRLRLCECPAKGSAGLSCDYYKAAPAADVVGEHHESSQNKLLEIIIENFEGVVVFQNKTRASNFGDDLIFLGYREFAGSAASFQKEFCIGGFNAELWAEGLPISVFHGGCGATVCGLDGVGVFYVGFAVYRDDFFFGICLGEDDAFPAETEPAIGFIDWFEISVEDVVPVFGVSHL